MSFRVPILFTLLAVFTYTGLEMAPPVTADIVAATPQGGDIEAKHNTGMAGWEFKIDDAIVLTQLGLYDVGEDGLSQSHQIGIWDVTGQMRVSSVVPSGSASVIRDGYHYVEVAPTLLTEGHDYVIGVFFEHAAPDRLLENLDGLQMAPGIHYLWPRAGLTDVFSFPDNRQTDSPDAFNHFSANFQYIVAVAGDLNLDGLVNSRDLDIVRSNWGSSVNPGDLTHGDADGMGSVASEDLDLIRANWEPMTSNGAISWAGNVDPINPLLWDASTKAYVGRTSDGNIIVNGDGTLLAEDCYLGHDSGAQGTVVMKGPGSTWTNAASLYVAYGGSGTLTLEGGAVVTASSSSIGERSGSTGEASVLGPGSAWTNDDRLYVGYSGSGTLAIGEGGRVGDKVGYVGSHDGSISAVTVDGPDSIWTNSDTLYIGVGGSGSLEVTRGGEVGSGVGYIAYDSGSSGAALVSGTDSAWGTGSLYVGGNMAASGGTGTLTVADGGTLGVSNTLKIWDTGSLSLSGTASRINTGSFIVEPGGQFTHTSGTLAVYDGCLYFGPGEQMIDGTGNPTIRLIGGDASVLGELSIGRSDTGTLAISEGGTMCSGNTYVGYRGSSTGAVSVSGTASTWDVGMNLYLGLYGRGTLEIMEGAMVSVADATCVGWGGSAVSGEGGIRFGVGGGVLETQSLLAGSSQIGGTGTVIARGLVSDVTLLFDAPESLQQTINLNSLPNQHVTIELDVSDPHNVGYLGAGYEGSGSLTICNSVVVKCGRGSLGFRPGSTGSATVTGCGSVWDVASHLLVGGGGEAELRISDAAAIVSGYDSHLAWAPGSRATATVSGAGSTWTVGSDLYVGRDGSGTLGITGTALVRVAGKLTVDRNGDGDSLVKMSTGGRLALFGEGDDDLEDFFDLIEGTDAFQYWDNTTSGWLDLNTAMPGSDYTLKYVDIVGSALFGYTILTVGTGQNIPGDLDQDGMVNSRDLDVVRAHWGLSALSIREGDVNGDGWVGSADLDFVRANWGNGVVTVPEPGILLLVILGSLTAVLPRVRRATLV